MWRFPFGGDQIDHLQDRTDWLFKLWRETANALFILLYTGFYLDYCNLMIVDASASPDDAGTH